MARGDSQLEFGDLRPEGRDGSGARGQFFLKGNVVTCSCPDCGSPMTIRLWLMAADCWVCGANVVLSEEQQQEVKRLLAEAQAQQAAAPAAVETPAARPVEPPKPKPAPVPAPKPKPRPTAVEEPRAKPRPPAMPVPAAAAAPPEPERRSAAHGPSRARRRLSEISDEGEVTVWLRDLFRNLPAWLISALLHMALLILLAMVLDMQMDSGEPPLVFSTRVADNPALGAEKGEPEEEPIEFEKKGEPEPKQEPKEPEPPKKEPEPEPKPKAEPKEPKPPPIVPNAATATGGAALTGRSPDARPELTKREGGTTLSEAAVARGLDWLAKHQNSDGSWSLHAFHKAGGCNGRCKNPGVHSDTSATGLALLPFLGVGETHQKKDGKYRQVVENGLAWLVRNQGRNGDLRGAGQGRMYAHGQAAIALCEAYAMTRDDDLRAAAQSAVDFIVRAQHSQGGWRYEPGQAGDVSVVGWQYMALRSGQMGYLNVPTDTLERANEFIDTCKTDRYGGLYTYQPGVNYPLPAMTAEALLCRQYGGWARDHQGLAEGSRWLLQRHPPNRKQPNMYYWYYATQMMHHLGGSPWNEWNGKMRDMLIAMQEQRGHEAGSWTPLRGGDRSFDTEGGRLYMTALAICTLEVYYRHLPLYRSVATEK
jgi:outer membrane biosynthesis protein TonB